MMTKFTGITLIFIIGCVGIISAARRHLSEDASKIKEDCSECGILITQDKMPEIVRPWMVSIGTSYKDKKCFGALIDDQHILTAAQCVKKAGFQLFLHNVYFEKGDPDTDSRAFKIDKIFVHPKYGIIKSKGINIAKNDIALVKLTHKIKCDKTKNPICLPDSDFKLSTGDKSFLICLGVPDPRDKDQPGLRRRTKRHFDTGLLHGLAENLDSDNCTDVFPGSEKIKDHMLCEGLAEEANPCHRALGGPLMHKTKEKYHVVGIFSAENLNSFKRRFIFTDVVKFLDWVKKEKKGSKSLLTECRVNHKRRCGGRRKIGRKQNGKQKFSRGRIFFEKQCNPKETGKKRCVPKKAID